MKSYYRIMLGRGSRFAKEAHEGGFIGADFDIDTDLTGKLPENWREFNKEFIPKFLKINPDKSKVSAGLACGALHTVAKGIKIGDVVLSPNGEGAYFVGEVTTDYEYVKEGPLQHRRRIKWYPNLTERSEMSQALKYSTGSIGTVSNITKYTKEIEELISGSRPPGIVATDEIIEDPSVFALEQHLEDFLIHNWKHTALGKKYNIFEEDGELIGEQYPSDTGPIDILAISKDKKELLVVELKKGRATDAVVGQIQRYMGYVKDELAENGQKVTGVIIALEDDLKLRRALSVTKDIEFYSYQVSFKLIKN